MQQPPRERGGREDDGGHVMRKSGSNTPQE
jgi:hypothetical protein